MKIGIWTAALLALGMAGGMAPRVSAQTPGDGDPSQTSASLSLDATVTLVDADRDRLIVTGDDGRTYTIDTYQAKIALRDNSHAGQTGDLVPGMRLHVTGTSLSRDLIEAARVSVLPYRSVRPVQPTPNPNAPVPAGQDQRVTLRGTVQSVDERRGTFVVQVNDHTRKVFLNDRTELRDLSDGDNRVPVRPGDRVTVVGDLQGDGTVLATLLTPRRLDDAPGGTRPAPASGTSFGTDSRHGRTLLGRVSKESDYFFRDIKIRLPEGREITVHVPKNTPVSRDGHSLSIHDVKDDQTVRVSGDYENDDFKADRIDVLDDADAGRPSF